MALAKHQFRNKHRGCLWFASGSIPLHSHSSAVAPMQLHLITPNRANAAAWRRHKWLRERNNAPASEEKQLRNCKSNEANRCSRFNEEKLVHIQRTCLCVVFASNDVSCAALSPAQRTQWRKIREKWHISIANFNRTVWKRSRCSGNAASSLPNESISSYALIPSFFFTFHLIKNLTHFAYFFIVRSLRRTGSYYATPFGQFGRVMHREVHAPLFSSSLGFSTIRFRWYLTDLTPASHNQPKWGAAGGI